MVLVCFGGNLREGAAFAQNAKDQLGTDLLMTLKSHDLKKISRLSSNFAPVSMKTYCIPGFAHQEFEVYPPSSIADADRNR